MLIFEHGSLYNLEGELPADASAVDIERAAIRRPGSDVTLIASVTNLGEHGVDLVHGVIYPPKVALVGFGAVRERPWAADGMLSVRPTVTATLAADHRASDGHRGSRLLTLIDRQLQKLETLRPPNRSCARS